jgi:hypothetical protein
MARTQDKPTLVNLIDLILEGKESEAAALSNESLYEKVSGLYGGKPSRRDFRAALDQLQSGNKLVIKTDPSDRRKRRIWKSHAGEGGDMSIEQDLAAMQTSIADFFRKHPEYSPVYVSPGGATRIRGIDPSELPRMFRYTTPLVKALMKIRECEKLGKKPDEATVRNWSQQYERLVDAIAKATATEFCEAVNSKREIKPKNVIDHLDRASQQVSP